MFPATRFAGQAAAALVLLASGSVCAETVRFRAALTGAQEVGPVTTQAFGTALLELNEDRDSLEIFLSVFGLDFDGSTPSVDDDVTGVHIHRAPAGANGSVVFGLLSPSSDLDGDTVGLFVPLGGTLFSDWDGAEGNGTTLAAELANLLGNGLYINVHTFAHRGGEIRGQIEVVPIPAAIVLMLAALAALVPLRRPTVRVIGYRRSGT